MNTLRANVCVYSEQMKTYLRFLLSARRFIPFPLFAFLLFHLKCNFILLSVSFLKRKLCIAKKRQQKIIFRK
jgi:hypothetical protein